MPDRDAILRGLYELPLIEPRGIEGSTRPEPNQAWSGIEHGAEFWVTREGRWTTAHFVLRTQGDMQARASIERDFTEGLGKPDFRSSEIGFPQVDSTYWKETRIRAMLPKSSKTPQ